MRDLVIQTTPMSLRIPMTPFGQIDHSTYLDMKLILRGLIMSEYDWKTKRYVYGKKFRHYDEKNRIAYVPRYLLEDIVPYLKINNIPFRLEELDCPEGAEVEIRMIDTFTPRDERQAKAIAHLNTTSDPVKGISLQTGVGKTVTSIAHLAHAGRRAMIGVEGLLLTQWREALLEWTTMEAKDIFVVKGAQTLKKLMRKIDRRIHPKVILYSIATLRGYARNEEIWKDWPSFDKLAHTLNVGIRIIDEGHRSFHTNFIQSLRLPIASTVVLTATFDVTDRNVRRVFQKTYPKSIRFGEGDYDRYVDIRAYGYRAAWAALNPWAYSSQEGYSQAKWENWLLNKKSVQHLDRAIRAYIPVIHAHYIQRRQTGDKLLVLVQTVAMCEMLRKRFQEKWPMLRCGIYVQETDDSAFAENDIIVSTIISSGTARDIPGLLMVLQTCSVRSPVQNRQNLGRLRRRPDNKTPVFAYMVNTNLEPHRAHHEVRTEIFRPLAKSWKSINIQEGERP